MVREAEGLSLFEELAYRASTGCLTLPACLRIERWAVLAIYHGHQSSLSAQAKPERPWQRSPPRLPLRVDQARPSAR